MSVYGPIAMLADSKVHQIITDQNASRVVIYNQSGYDVYISYQQQPPNPSTIAAPSNGDWPYVLHAGDRIESTIPPDSYIGSPLGYYWQGIVWYYVLNTTGQLAATGTLSNQANLWITTYAPGDQTEVGSPQNNFVQLVNQPRIISLPPACTRFYTGSWDQTVSTTKTLGGVPLSAANSTAQHVGVYFYGLSVDPIGATSTLQTVQLIAEASNVAHTVFTQIILWQGTVAYDTTAKTIKSGQPVLIIPEATDFQPWNAAWTIINFYLKVIAGTNTQLNYWVHVNVDLSGNPPVQDYGYSPIVMGSSGGSNPPS